MMPLTTVRTLQVLCVAWGHIQSHSWSCQQSSSSPETKQVRSFVLTVQLSSIDSHHVLVKLWLYSALKIHTKRVTLFRQLCSQIHYHFTIFTWRGSLLEKWFFTFLDLRIISLPNTYINLPPLKIGKERCLGNFYQDSNLRKASSRYLDEKFKVTIENVFDVWIWHLVCGYDVWIWHHLVCGSNIRGKAKKGSWSKKGKLLQFEIFWNWQKLNSVV